MSDSDDGFDKEAAREELREKYENEREDREATARMSDLLLQGATMTNDHCDRCGTPLFRQDGQTFCPTCQHDAQRASQQQTDQQADQPTGDDQEPADAARSDQRAPADATQAAAPERDQHTTDDRQQRQPAATTTDDPQRRGDAAQRPDTPARPSGRDRNLPEHAPTAERRADTGEAADALESSIAALARRAASADDPRTAREYLEAAREAAEALAALR